MKSVHYEVEYKPFDMCCSRFYPDDECGYEGRRYRSAAAAMKRANEIKENGINIEATRVVKVTREPLSRRKIKKGAFETFATPEIYAVLKDAAAHLGIFSDVTSREISLRAEGVLKKARKKEK